MLILSESVIRTLLSVRQMWRSWFVPAVGPRKQLALGVQSDKCEARGGLRLSGCVSSAFGACYPYPGRSASVSTLIMNKRLYTCLRCQNKAPLIFLQQQQQDLFLKKLGVMQVSVVHRLADCSAPCRLHSLPVPVWMHQNGKHAHFHFVIPPPGNLRSGLLLLLSINDERWLTLLSR